MTQKKINVNDLRRIINEEVTSLAEATKSQSIHAAKAAVSGAASKLLDAIESFKETASPAALGEVTAYLSSLEKVLDHMTDSPGAYVEKPKVEPRMVSLKPVKNND
jgi:molecular chaperone GrpE (heat shock protein)